MTFEEARKFVLPFGKHKGKTLDAVASTDSGLRYLDWLYGQEWIRREMADALAAFLSEPSIAKELEEALLEEDLEEE